MKPEDQHTRGMDESDCETPELSVPLHRRRLLKALAIGGAAAMPVEKWTRPVVESVVLPAHAQTTDDDEEPRVAEPGCLVFTSDDSFVVPEGITEIEVQLEGGGGEDGAGFLGHPGGSGGDGALVTATIAVSPGEILGISFVAGGAGGTNAGDTLAGAGGAGGETAAIDRGGSYLVWAGGGGGGGGAYDRDAGDGSGGDGGDAGSGGSASADGDAGGTYPGGGGQNSQAPASADGEDGTDNGTFVAAGGGAAGSDGASPAGADGGGGGGGAGGDSGSAGVSDFQDLGAINSSSARIQICWGEGGAPSPE